jgi:Ser-tRNA(Ala) deacylase AlaX
MAKATLEFDLENEEDSMLFSRMHKATDMASALWTILYNTKKSIVWEVEADEEKFKQDPYELIDKIYSKIWEIVKEDNNINIDDLIN